MVKRALKLAASFVLGRYRVNRIYQPALPGGAAPLPQGMTLCALGEAPPATVADPTLLERFSYAGHDAYGYGLMVNGDLAAICWFWGHRRFDDPLLWVLRDTEAILVDLVTAPGYRGQGLAPALIQHASADMRQKGFGLYTWMWHTHRASARAFDKAGWRQIAWVLEIRPFGLGRPMRICWRTGRDRTPMPIREGVAHR